MTPTTPADAAGLAQFDTEQLMLDLLRRANLALRDYKTGESERLFRAVLAYRPNDGAILQVLGELALANTNWEEARDLARRSLCVPVPHPVLIRAAAIFCCAAYMLEGEEGVRPTFAQLRTKLAQAMDAVADPVTDEEINVGITAALCAGDREFAHTYFLRRYKPWLTVEVETSISGCMPLYEWCQKNGASFRVIDPPRRISSKGLPASHGVWDFDTDGFNMAVIPRAQMVSGFDFVFAPTGEMLLGSGNVEAHTGTGWFPRIHAGPVDRVIHLWPSHVTDIDEAALFVSCSQGWHMGHWIVDILPRLRGLALRPDLKVAIPTQTPKKHRDFLRLFGIEDSQIINCDLNHRYRFRELAVVQTGNAHNAEPNTVSFLAKHLRTSPRPATAPLRLFLERDMKNRAVANEDEFYRELDRLGFKRLNLAAMSVAEQRDALSAAEVAITTYGSDLLALYMMNEGAALIELNWDRERLDARAAPMCSMVGVKYHLMLCAPADTNTKRLYKKDRDFIVDIPTLHGILRTAGIAMP
jgi:capsular polysaccharide biosynthesis protein